MGLLSRVSTFGSNWLFFFAFFVVAMFVTTSDWHYVTTRHSPAGTAATACCKGDGQTGRTGRLQQAMVLSTAETRRAQPLAPRFKD